MLSRLDCRADFIINLLLGFGSGSIGLSLESRAADAAGSGSGIAAAVPSLLFFLFSPLCTCLANAPWITSFLRSNLSAPCGVILRHPSIRTLQRPEWACTLSLSLIALQHGHPTEAPNVPVSGLVCSFKWQWKNWNRIRSNFWSVHCPSAVGHHQGTPITMLTASLSHLLRGSNLLISRALKYTICFLDETFCSVVSHSKPNPELVSGIHSVHWICGALFHQHFLTNWDKFLCLLLAMQSFTWRPPVTTVLTSGQDASCMFHQPRQDKRFVAEWLLRAALNVTLDGSDGIIAFSMSPFDSWCVLVVTSALHISATRFLNAMIAISLSLFSVISR